MPTPTFQRATLIVADLEKSLAFYRDILGFSVEYVKNSEITSYSYTVFGIPKTAPMRFATLNSPTQTRVLALTEAKGMAFPPQPWPRTACTVIRADNMDEVKEKAAAMGLKMFPEETLKTQDGRIGRELGLLDPDGHLCVLYTITQAPPAA